MSSRAGLTLDLTTVCCGDFDLPPFAWLGHWLCLRRIGWSKSSSGRAGRLLALGREEHTNRVLDGSLLLDV
jgi:hypothetical protein